MKKSIKQISSFLTSFFLLISQIANYPAFAASEIKTAAGFALDIPAELASIDKIEAGSGPQVVHIQTAHGNYEAQKKIEKILLHLKKNYGFNTVLIEGSASELDPNLLRFFPGNPELNEKINDELTRKALVKGAELFLVDEPGAKGYGIEDLETYRANGAALKAVLSEREKTGEILSSMNLQIDRLTGALVNADLRSFLKRLEDFELNRMPVTEWVRFLRSEAQKTLSIDLSDAAYQIDWPMMVRLFKLEEMERKFSPEAFAAEREAFLKETAPRKSWIKHSSASLPADLYAEISELLGESFLHTASEGSKIAGVIDPLVSALPRDFHFEKYPNLDLFLGHRLLQSELRSEDLYAETSRLSEKIGKKLARTSEEKKILGLLAGHRLLKKLFALELTPSEYEKVLALSSEDASEESLLPSKMIERFKKLNDKKRIKDLSFDHVQQIDSLFAKALEFYRYVKIRDGEMSGKIKERIQQTQASRVVVITGGFHTRPLADFFAAEDYSYALVSPALTEFQGDGGRENYVQASLHMGWNYLSPYTLDDPAVTDPMRIRSDDEVLAVRKAIEKNVRGFNPSQAEMDAAFALAAGRSELRAYAANAKRDQDILDEIFEALKMTQNQLTTIVKANRKADPKAIRPILEAAQQILISYSNEEKIDRVDHVQPVLDILIKQIGFVEEALDKNNGILPLIRQYLKQLDLTQRIMGDNELLNILYYAKTDHLEYNGPKWPDLSKTAPVFYGNIVPTVTPFKTEAGQIVVAREAVRKYLDYLQSLDVQAVLVVGATGEFQDMTPELRQSAIQIMTEESNKAGLLTYANVTGATYGETLKNAAIAKKAGANVLVVAPLYYQESTEKIEGQIREISEAVRLPIAIYNNPALSMHAGMSLPASVIKSLWQKGLIVAVKDSSGKTDFLKEFIRTGVPVYTGDEGNIEFALTNGAVGVVGSSGSASAVIQDIARETDPQRIAVLQAQILEFRAALTVGTKKIPAGLKYTLRSMMSEQVLNPEKRLTKDETAAIDAAETLWARRSSHPEAGVQQAETRSELRTDKRRVMAGAPRTTENLLALGAGEVAQISKFVQLTWSNFGTSWVMNLSATRPFLALPYSDLYAPRKNFENGKAVYSIPLNPNNSSIAIVLDSHSILKLTWLGLDSSGAGRFEIIKQEIKDNQVITDYFANGRSKPSSRPVSQNGGPKSEATPDVENKKPAPEELGPAAGRIFFAGKEIGRMTGYSSIAAAIASVNATPDAVDAVYIIGGERPIPVYGDLNLTQIDFHNRGLWLKSSNGTLPPGLRSELRYAPNSAAGEALKPPYFSPVSKTVALRFGKETIRSGDAERILNGAGLAALAEALGKEILGRPAFAEALTKKIPGGSYLAELFGEGAVINFTDKLIPNARTAVAPAAGEGGLLALDPAALELLSKNPRALFYLLLAASRLRIDGKPFLVTFAEPDAVAGIKSRLIETLTMKGAAFGRELEDVRALVKALSGGSLIRFIEIEKATSLIEAEKKLVEESHGGAVVWHGSDILSSSEIFEEGAHFIAPADLSPEDWLALVAGMIITKTLADQLAGMQPHTDSASLRRQISDFLHTRMPGFVMSGAIARPGDLREFIKSLNIQGMIQTARSA